jgi:serine/threonine protein kinase
MKQSDLDSLLERLFVIYGERLGLPKTRFRLIQHEDAIVAWVFRIDLLDGSQQILKVFPRAGDSNRELYSLCRMEGKIPVPKVIRHFPPESNLPGALLMEFINGELMDIEKCSEELFFEAGASMGRLHMERAEGYGDPINSQPLDDHAIHSFLIKFSENMNECRGHLSEPLLGKCQQFFDQKIGLLAKVDGPCLVHRDFRPRNILATSQGITGIIDWSSSRFWFAEEDFFPLESGDWSKHSEQKKLFLRGYASIRPIPDYLRVMPLIGLNQALGVIGFTLKRQTWNGPHSSLYRSNLQQLESILSRF